MSLKGREKALVFERSQIYLRHMGSNRNAIREGSSTSTHSATGTPAVCHVGTQAVAGSVAGGRCDLLR